MRGVCTAFEDMNNERMVYWFGTLLQKVVKKNEERDPPRGLYVMVAVIKWHLDEMSGSLAVNPTYLTVRLRRKS